MGFIMSARDFAIASIQKMGFVEPSSTSNKTMLDFFARAVMRNPNPDAQAVITDLKSALAHFFTDKSDDEISHILSKGAESRGHFTSAQSVRDFCSGKTPSTPSMDIAAVDGLLSALNYARHLNAIDPHDPYAKILTQVNALQIDAPPYIGDTFETRKDAMTPGRIARGVQPLTEANLNEHNAVVNGEQIVAPNRTISQASDFASDYGMDAYTKTLPKRQKFQPEDGEYAKSAMEAGIPLVGHVSGTTPGNLTVANSLLKQAGKTGLDEVRAKLLAGMTAASFHRSGFHSPPEVLVGLRHYLGTKATTESVGKDLSQLYRDALALMSNVGKDDLQLAMILLIDEMVAHPNLTADGTVPEQQRPVRSAEEHIIAMKLNGEINVTPGIAISEIITHANDSLAGDFEDLMAEITELSKQEQPTLGAEQHQPALMVS